MPMTIIWLVKRLSNKNRRVVLRYARYLLFKQRVNNLPVPMVYAAFAGLCMFILLPVMPLHPMSIPIVIGGGLAGGLLLIGGWDEQARKYS